MKTKRKSENLCFTVYDVILCFLMLFVSLNDVVDGGMSNDNQKILSRRRRYLTFPEGSSFQVVYETYQPVSDYNNLLIFYLTQALAWELPNQAYHPEEHLQDIWDDVVFPSEQYDDLSVNSQVADAAANNLQNSIQEKNSADRNNNLNPADSQNLLQNQNQQGVPFQNQKQQGVPLQNQNQQGVPLQNQNPKVVPVQNRNDELGTGGNNYYTNYSPNVPNNYYYSNYRNPQKVSGLMEPLTKTISNKMDYYLSYADKVLNQISTFATEKHSPWKKTDWNTYTQSEPINYQYQQRPNFNNRRIDPGNYKYQQSAANIRSEPSNYQQSEADNKNYAFAQSRHFIHPAFGKRSTDKSLTPEETFNINYHRTSRQTMYKKIAKFLDTDEISGAECVLKALCETGKRKNADKKPGPFLMEILRVVFSLPETDRKEEHPVYSQYDHAHTTPNDCDELFPKCKSSLWNKNVILQ